MRRGRIILLALSLGIAAWPAHSQAAPERKAAGSLWDGLSGLFRKCPLPEPLPGHLSVAGDIPRRRTLRSPFAPPLGEASAIDKSRAGGKNLTLSEGRTFLAQAASDLKRLKDDMEAGVSEGTIKSLDDLNERLTASVFPNKEQRAQAQEMAASVAALKRRAELRLAFAKRNPRVTFIIWAPQGKALAVIDRQVRHEGDALGPGVTVASIQQSKVIFDIDGEKIAVGLR